jgi:RHS repeat-associated protein
MTYMIGESVTAQCDGSGTVLFLLQDGHGSTRMLVKNGTYTNPADYIAVYYSYDAFGNALGFNPATASTLWLFGGDAMYDPASGQYFNGNGIRTRNPGSPDFNQMDSFGFGNSNDPITLNAEIYGDGNPINNDDPSGHYSLTSTTVASGLAAGIAAEGYGALGEVQQIANAFGQEAAAYEVQIDQLAVDTGNGIADEIDSDLGEVSQLAQKAENFRQNLISFTKGQHFEDPETELEDLDAHHVFPQKFAQTLEKWGKSWGLNIHNPLYGQWVERGDHQDYSALYNQYWQQFIDIFKNAGVTPSQEDILDYGRAVMDKVYGLPPNY